VSPGWFDLYGLPILSGRAIDDRDRRGTEPVIVVTRRFAEAFFGDASPLGRQVRARFNGTEITPYTVVGVAGDALYQSARRGRPPTAFSALAQQDEGLASFSLTMDTPGGSAEVLRGVEQSLARALPGVAMATRTLDDQMAASLRQERFLSVVAGSFGVLAAILAALGLYGVAAYSVHRRRPEIAVRMALGSSVRGVVRLMLRQVGTLIAIGAAAGLVLSVWATAIVEPLLYGLTPRDPATLAVAAAIIAMVGLVAGWLPARRAARLDPTIVLKG
jgi:hypothetical protein